MQERSEPFFLAFSVLLIMTWSSCMAENSFFKANEYNAILFNEISISDDIYNKAIQNGITENETVQFDFIFYSNKIDNLKKISSYLNATFQYSTKSIKRGLLKSSIEGTTPKLLVGRDNLTIWTASMVKAAYQFDCKFGEWGFLTDPKNKNSIDPKSKSAKEWFNEGIKYFDKQDFVSAFSAFKFATINDCNFADGFDGIGSVSISLFLYKKALANYDKAIALNSTELSYFLNRGTAKDYLGEYKSAIEDYDLVILNYPKNAKAYFNRGNTKINLNDYKGACEDWQKAKELGAEYAEERILHFCNKN